MSRGTGTIVSAFNVDIRKHDIHTLENGKWLNDEIINFYSQLIMQRAKTFSDSYPDVHVYNTFFYQTLSSSGYAKVRKWSKKVWFFQKNLNTRPSLTHSKSPSSLFRFIWECIGSARPSISKRSDSSITIPCMDLQDLVYRFYGNTCKRNPMTRRSKTLI